MEGGGGVYWGRDADVHLGMRSVQILEEGGSGWGIEMLRLLVTSSVQSPPFGLRLGMTGRPS